MPAPPRGRSWKSLPARLWFIARTLAVRGRFLTGKASYIRSRVSQTTTAPAEVFDRQGRPLGSRLLAHLRLGTDPPRTGKQGWELFAQRSEAGSGGRTAPTVVRLQCAFCSHLFFVEVSGVPAAGGSLPAASFAASWFSFMGQAYRGEPALSCPHCEQSSVPGVRFLTGPR